MSAATAFDLWLAAPGASTAPAAIIQAPRSELNGEFSPDGRFLAYQASESGRDEVYLARFPVDAERWPVSTGGGTNPHWSRDGRELLFMSGRSLMRAPVNVTAAEVEIGAATPVFSLRQNPDTGTHTVFTVAADGQRFLFNVPLRSGPTPITLVVNWPALLPR